MENLLRFKKPNEHQHVRGCIEHVSKRAEQRFNTKLEEFEIFKISDLVKSKQLNITLRESSYQVWVRTKLNGKTCFALYNESLQVIQTLYTQKMMTRHLNALPAYAKVAA